MTTEFRYSRNFGIPEYNLSHCFNYDTEVGTAYAIEKLEEFKF